MTAPTPALAPSTAGPRIEWIDMARGAAMVLLLVWHAASIPEVLGTAMPRSVEVVNDGLHLLRMPLLMFLSGMVALRALARPLGTYYRGKLATLVWPYALWALLDLATFEDLPLSDPWSWNGTGYLWFLFFVIVFSLVAPPLRRVPPLLVAGVAMVGSSTLHLRFPDDDLLLYAVFFFSGLAAAQHSDRFVALLRTPLVVVPCGLVGVATCVVWASGVRVNEGYVAPFALAAVLAAVALASRVRNPPRFLGTIGRRSIVWYLAHFPLMHLVVVLLNRVGPDVPWVVYFVADLGVALAVCPLLVRLSRRPPVSWAFAAPIR